MLILKSFTLHSISPFTLMDTTGSVVTVQHDLHCSDQRCFTPFPSHGTPRQTTSEDELSWIHSFCPDWPDQRKFEFLSTIRRKKRLRREGNHQSSLRRTQMIHRWHTAGQYYTGITHGRQLRLTVVELFFCESSDVSRSNCVNWDRRTDAPYITHDSSMVLVYRSNHLTLHFLQHRHHGQRVLHLCPPAATPPSVCCVCEESKMLQWGNLRDIKLIWEAAYFLFLSLMYSSVWKTRLWRSSTWNTNTQLLQHPSHWHTHTHTSPSCCKCR